MEGSLGFEDSLVYIVSSWPARPCLKKPKINSFWKKAGEKKKKTLHHEPQPKPKTQEHHLTLGGLVTTARLIIC